jgi:hypothetical protein
MAEFDRLHSYRRSDRTTLPPEYGQTRSQTDADVWMLWGNGLSLQHRKQPAKSMR